MIGLVALAFVAGAVSILSPCCLPIVPGYVSYIGGVAAQEEGSHRRVLGSAALFVLGFGVVFTILGATASALGGFLLVRLPLFAKIAGVFVIVMGFAMLGVLRIPFASGRGQVDLSTIRGKPATAFPLGMAFAFGWTPAVGPVLGGILATAATVQTVWKGALLLFVYSLGMGVPFLLLALGSTGTGRAFRFLRRRRSAIERVGGVVLLGMGTLLVTGRWEQMFIPLIRWVSNRGWPPI